MPIEPSPSRWAMRPPTPDDDDVAGVGADLEPGTLLAAYRAGLFPMHIDGELAWWSPEERGVLALKELRVTRSLAQAVRRHEIRVDTAFDEVVAACGDPSRHGAWINDDMIHAYRALHELGWAHSVEAWRDGELVGGLYGVAIGGLFAGESMFHRARDASKVALVGLVELLRDEHADVRLIDTQWVTDHLATLGVRAMDREDYLAGLPELLAVPQPAAFS